VASLANIQLFFFTTHHPEMDLLVKKKPAGRNNECQQFSPDSIMSRLKKPFSGGQVTHFICTWCRVLMIPKRAGWETSGKHLGETGCFVRLKPQALKS
jgi:hypothetical protein